MNTRRLLAIIGWMFCLLVTKQVLADRPIQLADPTIFYHQGTYYLYGTGSRSDDGFFVYTSTNLKDWTGPAGVTNGYALKKGDSYGDKGFWAPQVFEKDGKFYMAYTANEQISFAVSESPLGPFRAFGHQPLSGPVRQIDPYVFKDSDGQYYLYHVRLTEGNRVYVAKLHSDLQDVDTASAKEVLHGETGWENTWNAKWPVTEGPTVIKKNNTYYLLYSANDFRNPDYAVGYATSKNPMGPWIKQKDSPIISRKQTNMKGTGHGDVIMMPGGGMKYVLHTHRDSTSVAPRLTGIIDIAWKKQQGNDALIADASSFQYLQTSERLFSNPLLKAGADPFSFYKDGFYYYTHTKGNSISLWKVRNIADLPFAKERVVFEPPANEIYSKHLWAPEIHFLQGRWYIYFAASAGDITKQRMHVLENDAADPTTGTWTYKGQVADATNKWAIDANLFEWNGQLYMLWSGWEADNNVQQNIYIAAMSNPWTISSDRVCISKPTYEWEKHGTLKEPGGDKIVLVNEGPQSLIHDKDLFVVYSASGCWTDYYALGLLRFTGGDLLNANNWKKSPDPVFTGNAADGIYAPGHNSFFKSPDGKQDWILYHANGQPNLGCGAARSPRAQMFTWHEDGTPDFGKPVKAGQSLPVPAE